MTTAPEDLAAVQADLGRALKRLESMADEYKRRKAYYDGDAREYATSQALRRLIDLNAEAHPVSFAHIPVDAVIDKINLKGFDATNQAANDALSEWYDELEIESDADEWHRHAGFFADYYVIVDVLEETEQGVATRMRLAPSSPLTTVTIYDEGDGEEVFSVKAWPKGSGVNQYWRANVYYDDVTVMLRTKAGANVKGFDPTLYEPLLDESGEEGSERQQNAGGVSPVVHYAVDGEPYGKPLHEKAFGPQDAITKIDATNLAAVEGQGFPMRWALADPAAEIDDDIDDDFGTDSATTTGDDVDGLSTPTTGLSRVRSLPGTIAMLRGVKSVGQFDEATPDGFLKNLDWHVRAMAVATGTPFFEFDMSGEQPSGESRRRASGRLNRHAMKVRRRLEKGHLRLASIMLAALGIDPDEAGVSVRWLPLEVETDKEGLELVGTKIENGVPVATALLEAGYTDEQVAEWYPEGDTHATPALVAKLAPALQQLGAAAALGAVTDAEIAAMLPTLLKDARGEGVADDDAPELEAAPIASDSSEAAELEGAAPAPAV